MKSSVDITRLCTAWWERLSDSTKEDHQLYARQFLELLGWTHMTQIDTTSNENPLSNVSYVLRGGGESSVAAHFMMPGSLEPPSSIVERGLDFCESTRLLVNGTRRLNVGYSFITDFFRSYLYDVQTDELILYGDTPDVFDHDLADILAKANVERGSLEEIRRHPRSFGARQLRHWCHQWCEVIVSESTVNEHAAHLAIDRLLVLRYLFDHDMLERSGWRLRNRFSEVVSMAFSSDVHGCGKALSALYHDIWLDWKARLYKPDGDLEKALERDDIVAPMLKEFTLFSNAKFTIATILESFNFGDATEKARVRLVPEPDEDREAYLAKQTVQTVDDTHVTVDILEEGYRAIFYWYDRVADLYERLGAEFDSVSFAQHRPQEEDMDLFEWSEMDADRPGALGDRFRHVVEHGLVIYYSSERQYRTARLMLYLHVISSYAQAKHRFTQFPAIEEALMRRPRLLESDKRWMNQPPPDAHTEDWEPN